MTARHQLPRVLSLVPREGAAGCTWWRVQRPSIALQRLGVTADWDYQDNPAVQPLIPRYDAVMFERLSWAEPADALEQRRRLHAVGVLMLGEYDDDIWMAREDQKSHEELGVDTADFTPSQHRASTACFDGLVVSTERLRTVVHTFAPHMPVEVVGNYIDVAWWRKHLTEGRRHPKLRGATTIGWFGGDRYDRDLGVVAEAWRRVALQTGPKVQFVVQGYVPPVLAAAVPPERFHVIAWMPLQPTAEAPFYGVGLKNLDIACCAVADTMFNRSKTPIKLMEATLAGAAVVGTPTLYGPEIEHGADGLVAETADDWEAALLRLLRRAPERRRMVARMTAKVERRWDLARNAWRWGAAWERLLARTRTALAEQATAWPGVR